MGLLEKTGKKQSKKEQRELKVLLGLTDLYIRTGKPIGSNTLKDNGFEDLSSATIRNYYADLEAEGFLFQAHASGGRTPTEKAYRLYAQHCKQADTIDHAQEEKLRVLKETETKEIATYLQEAAELLSEMTGAAIFLSAPRFDHDLINSLKLVLLDGKRILAVIVTEFGLVHTEVLHVDRINEGKRAELEAYFQWRLDSDKQRPELIDEELAQSLYNELMVRYIVGYSNFTDEDIYRTGFSQLLAYPEFSEPATLAGGLSLFESKHSMRLLMRETARKNALITWVGSELEPYMSGSAECSVIALPYRVHQSVAGAIGILGPTRMPYKEVFALMKVFTEYVSEALTASMYKFKISYRHPESSELYIQKEEQAILLEHKGERHG